MHYAACSDRVFKVNLSSRGSILVRRGRESAPFMARPPEMFKAGREPTLPPSWECLGIRFQLWTLSELTHLVVGQGESRDETLVVGYLNLHGAALARREPLMAEFYRAASAVHLDGMAMTWVARLAGVPAHRRHRVTYADWTIPLLQAAADRQRRVFFIGSRPEVIARAEEKLRLDIPGLDLACHHGFFDAASGSEDNRRILGQIGEFAPHILMVGMGMPRQEEWILAHRDQLDVDVVLASGACMDYIAGEVATPPRWAGRIGLEWLFRLSQEPARLAGRYLVEPWTLAAPVLAECLRRSGRHPVEPADGSAQEARSDEA